MSFAIDVQRYKGNRVFTFNQDTPLPGLPKFFNLHFKSIVEDKTPLVGPGIYIISFDDEPLYIGKYLGTRDAPFSGNVINLRWSKHIATLTLRGKRLSMSQRALEQAMEHARGNEIIDALKISDKDVLHRDRGCQTTARRLNFAVKNWSDFVSLDNDTLKRFTFTYVRIEQPAENIATSFMRQFVSGAESSLIDEFYLPCNSTANKAAELKTVDLDSLVQATQNKLLQLDSTNEQQEDLATDKDLQEEVINSFEQRLEQAPVWAQNFVENLMSHFESKETVEVHYTQTGNGDMRLRVHWKAESGKYRNQNFATIEWRPNDEFFVINTEASAKDVNGLSMTLKSQGLPAQLKLRQSVYNDNKDALMRLFENAAILIKVRHGAVQI